ncbi:MAG TPA: hypothetical protein VM118_03545 [Acidobacteriota bacterium]|nr:hypothetical protein [Acidobacteriota bacterium]
MHAPARRWLEGQGFAVKSEFVTPWGICDLVAVRLDQAKVEERSALEQKTRIGPLSRVVLLDSIPDVEEGTSVSRRRLQREFSDFWSSDELDRQLQVLISRKFVTCPRRDLFQRRNGWAPLHEKVIAIELKLSRVEEVFWQARNHVRIADESYIGLPYENAERLVASRRAEQFHDSGIGVVAVHQDWCRVLLPANTLASEVDAVLQMHCVEQFWGS